MDAFIYQADLHCEECAQDIKDALDADGKRPADPDDESSFDSDDYPKGPHADGGGESDKYQHCGTCGVFLENSLTDDGIEYTVEQLAEYVTDDGGNADVLDEWASDLKSYSLDDKNQAFVLAAYDKVRQLEGLIRK